jgi:uncharacterized protein YdeI (YjbR/CyaY-like superfamily)
MAKPTNPLDFEDRDQWRSWLEENHTIKREAWLILYKKKYQDLGLALEEAVEEALCFGWIDGTLSPLNEQRYVLRFSPRTKNSIWSLSNIQRVEKLMSEGKMTDAGMQKVAEAKANGEWEAALRREQVDNIPEDLEEALREREGALSLYKVLPTSRKKLYIYWLQSAKRAETRQRRIQKIVEEVLNK